MPILRGWKSQDKEIAHGAKHWIYLFIFNLTWLICRNSKELGVLKNFEYFNMNRKCNTQKLGSDKRWD